MRYICLEEAFLLNFWEAASCYHLALLMTHFLTFCAPIEFFRIKIIYFCFIKTFMIRFSIFIILLVIRFKRLGPSSILIWFNIIVINYYSAISGYMSDFLTLVAFHTMFFIEFIEFLATFPSSVSYRQLAFVHPQGQLLS